MKKSKKILAGIMSVCMIGSIGVITESIAPAVSMTKLNAFADSDPAGNGILDPIEISFNEIFSSSMSYGDNDWYKFSLDTPAKVNVAVDISENVGSTYEIIDADNDDTTVFNPSTMAGTTTFKDAVYLSAGNYYIHFYYSSRNCEYNAKLISTPTEESFDSKSNNNIGNASPIKFDTEYTGQISVNDDADYYTFDVAEEGKVTFNFDGDLTNVDWKLYNNEEKVIQSGTFSKGESDDIISAMKSYVMTPGTFTLAITKNEASCGNYTLNVNYLKDYNSLAVNNAFATADINKDNFIDATDAAAILSYYAYLSTGGKETDMNVWFEAEFATKE